MPNYYVDFVNGNDTNDGLGWWKVAYTGGAGAQPVAGETATGAAATAKVLSVTGTWGVSGTIYFYGKAGTFTNETVNFTGGGSCAFAAGDLVISSFKTIYKTFAAGDNVYGTGNPEVAQSGTGVFTAGGLTVTGISGWTPATGGVIRAVGDSVFYTIRSFAGSTITLFRPYRGSSGTKVINLLTSIALASNNDLKPTGSGTATNRINLYLGWNPITNARTGMSYFTGNYYCLNSLSYWQVSDYGNAALNTGATPAINNTIFNRLFFYNWDFMYQMLRAGANTGNVINGVVVEGKVIAMDTQAWATYYDAEIFNPAGYALQLAGSYIDFIRPRICGTTCVQVGTNGTIRSVRFIDPILDETNAATYIVAAHYSGGNCYPYTLFRNPQVSKATLFSLDGTSHTGELRFEHINGANNHMRVVGFGETVSNGYTTNDISTYKNAAPSGKIWLFQSIYDYVERFEIPCEAGVAKTISCWLMKNSNPASTVTVANGGSGYAVGDTIAITQAGAGSSVIRVATITGSAVATISILSGGYNHAIANNLNTTAINSGGSGCILNITAVGTGYGTATLPFMRVMWPTGTGLSMVTNIVDETMANVDNAFQQVSHTVTPSVIGSIIVELHFRSANAGAHAWFDSFGVA